MGEGVKTLVSLVHFNMWLKTDTCVEINVGLGLHGSAFLSRVGPYITQALFGFALLSLTIWAIKVNPMQFRGK